MASIMRLRLVTAARLSHDVVVINSFSKYFCMTGWRVVDGAAELVRPIDRLQGNLAISVPALSQIAARGLRRPCRRASRQAAIYEANRLALLEGLPKAGLERMLPVDGAFYLYADIALLLQQLRIRQADAEGGARGGDPRH